MKNSHCSVEAGIGARVEAGVVRGAATGGVLARAALRSLSAACALALLSGAASGQVWTSAAQNLTAVGSANANWTSVDLNSAAAGGPVAAGTYVYFKISIGTWSGSGSQWSAEARALLTDANINGTTTVPGAATIYANRVAGTDLAAPNGVSISGAGGTRAIGWQGPLLTSYTTNVGTPTPLFLNYRQTFAAAGGASWTNTTVTLFAQAPAAPANDLCSGALDISADANSAIGGGGTFVSPALDVRGAAATDPGEPVQSCSTTSRLMVFYSFTPAQSGLYTISTGTADLGATPAGSRARSSLSVSLGTCGGLIQVACAAPTLDALPGTSIFTRSRVSGMRLLAGQTYTIAVARPDTSGGLAFNLLADDEQNYQLAIRKDANLPAAPANDECAGAIDISAGVNAAVAGGNAFKTAALMMTGATPSAGDPLICQPLPDHTVYYTLTPETSGTYLLSTSNLEADGGNVNATAVTLATGACGSLQTLACDDRSSLASRGRVFAELEAGVTYSVILSRNGPSAALETMYQLYVRRLAPATTSTEAEPNDTAVTANRVDVDAAGTVITGSTTGTGTTGGGAATADWHAVTFPASATLKRYTITYTSATVGHTPSIVGRTQTAGVPSLTTDSTIQTATTTRPMVVYVGGSTPATVLVRVTGTGATTAPYTLTVSAPADVTPGTLSRSFVPGPITFTTAGQTTADTKMWLYNAGAAPIPGFGNDDIFGSTLTQSSFTRSLMVGGYTLAVSNYNLVTNLTPASDDDFQGGFVTPFAGATMNSSTLTNVNCSFSVNDGGTPVLQTNTRAGVYDITWWAVNVQNPAPTRCNPADIAGSDGTGGPDNCVNNGDFQLFFQVFFGADCPDCGTVTTTPCNPADIASSDGTEGADGCVNNGDFQLFFQNFFGAVCPLCQ